MQPISELPAGEARGLSGLLFDLDDTLLDRGGALTEVAYSSLFELRRSGLELIAVTGRPSVWGEVIVRQWPIDGAVTENGAIAIRRQGYRVEVLDADASARAARQRRLEVVATAVQQAHPELRLADDVVGRRTDIALDIGENASVSPDVVDAAETLAHARGCRTVRSSVHLHLTLDGDDKASGTVRFLSSHRDPTECLARYAFIGDSGNDAACFAAFRTTVAVANFDARVTVPPRFVTRSTRAAGFVEAARVLLERRG